MAKNKLLNNSKKQLDSPLSVGIETGQIVIRVGLNTVKWAFEHHTENQPYNEGTGNFDQKWVVENYMEFGKDVMSEMTHEEEDGSTPLIEFLDKMVMEALEQGSAGVEECKPNTPAITR